MGEELLELVLFEVYVGEIGGDDCGLRSGGIYCVEYWDVVFWCWVVCVGVEEVIEFVVYFDCLVYVGECV